MSKTYRIIVSNGWVVIEFQKYGVYRITDNSMKVNIDYETPDLGYGKWDNEVVNEDDDLDFLHYLGVSRRLRWKEVIMTDRTIYAPSLERLQEALRHVVFKAYNEDDL